MKTANPDGLIAAVLLSFLATAGLFYVNIMPAIVAGLIDGLGFSNRDAGLVASANVYGAATGALAAVFSVRRFPWRTLCVGLLILLMVIDGLSTRITTAEMLIPLRFGHGLVGGMLTGTGLAVIARSPSPDRTFGMLLAVQYGLGGVGVMFLPQLVPLYGAQVLFLALAAFSLVTLLLIPFMGSYPIAGRGGPAAPGRLRISPALLLTLAALFLFQAANMGLAAYIIKLGEKAGLAMSFIGPTLGFASWIGMAGAGLVILMGDRYGRWRPLAMAMTCAILGNAAFYWSGNPAIYAVANALTAILWAMVIPYLLAISAAFDRSGQATALAGFCSKMGLASGPFAAALLVGDGNYDVIIMLAVAALIIATAAAIYPARLLDGTGGAERSAS